MIIEEPDWQNKIDRFGSVYRLEDEIGELRKMFREADPRSSEWTAEREVRD
jgi:hypothetical protein